MTCSTVVGILDRDDWCARTDNIVLVLPQRRTLCWIPRDLWSPRCSDRINGAFARGGHPLLMAALADLGFPVDASLVLQRRAVERLLEPLVITVPVPRTRRYLYPLAPRLLLEDGSRLVEFRAPEETLRGERLHQWLGARRSADTPAPRLPDLDRIERQQVLVRRLLEEDVSFASVLNEAKQVSMEGSEAIRSLAAVRADWRLKTLDRVTPVTIQGQQVLRLRHPLRHWLSRRSPGRAAGGAA